MTLSFLVTAQDRVLPAEEATDLASSALEADAMFLPEKLVKKLVSTMLKVPELPNALRTQLRPRYVEQAVLAVELGLVKAWPSTSSVTTLTTFWKTLPSARTMPPESISKACPLLSVWY